MDEELINVESEEENEKGPEVTYNTEKDFYKGIGGEFRYKAEGLFKKAKEKGISIEQVDVATIRENQADFPGIGNVELPAYLVKVTGKQLQTGQVMVDGKQIDYYNRYQKYVSDKIEGKNLQRDERGRLVRENGRPKPKTELELFLTEWERFDVGRTLVEEKEYGLEKTITGACDRVIRKLMGENDWLNPGEARLLDEEFNEVQKKVQEQEVSRQVPGQTVQKKATERQIGYFKAKLKNLGMNPEDETVISEILRQAAISAETLPELSTMDMSRLIDNVASIVPKAKDSLVRNTPGQEKYSDKSGGVRQ